MHLHPSYPASLEREGFVSNGGSSLGGLGGAGGYASLAQQQPSSPEFELKAVGASSGSLRHGGSLPAPAAPAAAAAAAGDKSRLLGAASSSQDAGTLLALTAASSSGKASRGPSGKLKTSPKASQDRMDGPDAALQRRFSSLEDGADGEGSAPSAALRPRHPSSGGETLHL